MRNIEISHIKEEDNDIVVDILAEVFGYIDDREEIKRKISKRLNNNLSIKISFKDKIVGCYLLGEKSINEFIRQISQNELKDFPRDQTKIINLPSNLSDNGLQGISLAILPDYRKLGLGKKMKQYVNGLNYDYTWGVQDKKLNNIDFWTKTREVFAESNTHFATYMLKKTISEKYKMKHLKNFKIFESVFETPFYIFGSEDSQDYDVLVSVDHIPQNIDEAHNICKYYNDKLSSTLLPDKELNCNLGVFEDGKLVKVFKGTVDELNNVIYYTYDNHKQFYPNPIIEPINRDVDEKILRVARFIITFYSRTELRSQIKAALRGDLKLKLQVLKQINFVDMVDFPGKKEKFEDIYKVLAFQFGQIFSLVDGFESDSYTKNGILKNYPDLKNLLKRNPLNTSDLETLNKYLSRFIDLIESKIDTIKLVEN
jgi:hypothetical protein